MEALVKLLIPFVLGGLVALFFILFTDVETQMKYASLLISYFIPFLGYGVIISGSTLRIFDPLALFAFLTFVDCDLSLFLVWNLDYAKRIPGVGMFIQRTESSGRTAMERYKWLKRFGFFGLVVFVMLPWPGTGAIVGSIVGRMLGFSAAMTFAAVMLGSFLRSLLLIFLPWSLSLPFIEM